MYNEEYAQELEEEKSNVVPIRDQSVARYFDKNTFIPKLLADEIANEYPVLHDGQTFYMYKDGVYHPDSRRDLHSIIQAKLKNEARRNRTEETLYYLQAYRLVNPNDLNTNKEVINVQNGLYNVSTGELEEHTPEVLSTIQLPVTYDPEATCPRFDQFLSDILPEESIPMAEEMIGYAMVPDTRLKKAFMLTGSGDNGKSVLIYAIEQLLGGKNVSNVELQHLESDKFAKAQLFGKLANTFSDLSSRIMESSKALKTISSGDTISGERKGIDRFSFTPFATLIFSANEIPSSKELDPAFFDRWIILELPRQFPLDQQDKMLKYKITTPEERSGLFNRALQGLNRVMANGQLSLSESSIQRKEQYQREADNVLMFVDEICVIHSNAACAKDKLYDEYKKFALENGYRPLGKIKFNKRLKYKYPQLDDTWRPTGSKVNYWSGIGLKAEEVEPEGGDLQL